MRFLDYEKRKPNWELLLKKENSISYYVFVFRIHKRVAYIYSGVQGEIAKRSKIQSEHFVPIDAKLNEFLATKNLDGYEKQSNILIPVEFYFNNILEKTEEEFEFFEDNFWDFMDDLNELLFSRGLSANEGFVQKIENTFIMQLFLFDRLISANLIKEHLEKYCTDFSFKINSNILEQIVSGQNKIMVF